MTDLSVADIATYLADVGWQPRPEPWRGATIWFDSVEREVLVPERDGMRDGDLRIRELLDVVATAEGRSRAEVASDIASPLVDTQSYRTFSDGLPEGTTRLTDGVRALGGIHDVLVAAARAVVQGPHNRFLGKAPGPVKDLRDHAQLGAPRPGSYTYVLRVPVGGLAPPGEGALFGRRVLSQLHDALVAARTATDAFGTEGDLVAFDDAVTAGVSANLCAALGKLAGPAGQEPFEIGFRWARAVPERRPATIVRFPEGTGAVLQDAARRLRRHGAAGRATVTGVVESLHDDPPRHDRWRVKVRGELATARSEGANRIVWVRLGDQAAYDRAMSAHRLRAQVRATGELTSVNGRVELVGDRAGGFDMTDDR